MGWVKDPDDVYDDEALWAADIVGTMLWSTAVRVSGRAESDGVLSPKLLHDALTKFKTPFKRQTVKLLVELGLFHTPETLRRCGECSEHGGSLPSPEHLYVHRWWVHLLDGAGKNDKLHRALDQARRSLRSGKDRELAMRVRQRDRDECQYCGIHTRWEDRKAGDKKSLDLGEFDHVDPFAEVLNSFGNVVVSCKGCNSDKKRRTPAQWAAAGGRLLLRAPSKITDRSWIDPGSICDQSGPITDPGGANGPGITDLPRVTRDSGPIPDPNQTDPATGPVDHLSVPGSGPGDPRSSADPGTGPGLSNDDEGDQRG